MKDNHLLYCIWLSEIKGVGPIFSRRLLNYFNAPEIIFNLPQEELKKVNGIGTQFAKTIYNSKNLTVSKRILQDCIEKNIKITIYDDDKFPEILNRYEDSPTLLYYKGEIFKDLKGVGIVGARRCTEYGKNIAVEASSFLASNGIPVISGMAKGIDSYAHTACLKSEGYTVAVLASGADICYPKEHIELMKKIIKSGVVISEYPPGTPAKQVHFPKRNKLISVLSEKLLVAEAGEKSGSLITANYAKEKRKLIFAPPNSIFIKEFIGTNKLISEGASIYLNPEQLLIHSIDVKKHSTTLEKKSENNGHNELEEKILKLIENNNLTIDEIIELLKVDKKEIINTMLNLELDDSLQIVGGGRYKRVTATFA